MKEIKYFLLTVVFIYSIINQSIGAIIGDINNDGKIGMIEATNALQISAGIKSTTPNIYENFSSDPGWISTNSSKMYWDANNEAIFVSHYKPDANGIFYDIGEILTGDFTLNFDVKLTKADFDINLWIGLTNNDNYSSHSGESCIAWENTKYALINFLYVASHNGGKRFDLITSDGNVDHGTSNNIHWATEQWYNIELSYNLNEKILTLKVFQKNNLLDTHKLENYDLKSNNFKYFGVHMAACNNNTGTVEALVDNFSLKIPVDDSMVYHTAQQNIQLNGNFLSGDGEDEGIYIDNRGNIGIGTTSPSENLEVSGTVKATAFEGDGSKLTGISELCNCNNIINVMDLQQKIYSMDTSYSLEVPANMIFWRRTFDGHIWDDGIWEETGDGIRVYGRGYRQGNALTSKVHFNFQNTEIFIQWKVNGNGQYSCFGVGLFGAYNLFFGTTHHSYGGSILLSENTWYFTRIRINEDKTYEAVTTTNNYDNLGGTSFEIKTGALNSYWHRLNNTVFDIRLWDNYGSKDAYIEIKEIIYNYKSNS